MVWLLKNQLFFKKNVLYYKWEDYPLTRHLLRVPISLKEEVMHGCHDYPTSGHFWQLKDLQWGEMVLDVALDEYRCPAVC